jgi:hypothetical protein
LIAIFELPLKSKFFNLVKLKRLIFGCSMMQSKWAMPARHTFADVLPLDVAPAKKQRAV